MTIEENIGIELVINNVPAIEIQKSVQEIASKLDISDILHKFPYQVSGGQKQRCACARALVYGQKLVLADEPTGALDSKAALNLLQVMKTINQELNTTILMVTHDALSASFANRILFLKDGKVFNEIYKGDKTRRTFYNEILDVLAILGGGLDDDF